jgi:hypothetical protein
VTSRLLMPCRPPARLAAPGDSRGSCAPTPALDWQAPELCAFAAEVASTGLEGLALVRRAHRFVGQRVRPVYALDDLQPASRTLRRGRGSCSQRFGVLEAVARAGGIATRSRGLVVDGRFWYPRFPLLRWAVPDSVLLAWPEFRLDGGWVSASDLFGSAEGRTDLTPFTNRGRETLFDAVTRTAIDWDGAAGMPGACAAAGGAPCDLSVHVLADLGTFESRDALFAAVGQTFCGPTHRLVGPVLGRWAAGGA